MKTLLTIATGALVLSALNGGGAHAAPGVHLVTAIRALPHAPGVFRYAVTVRPVGGAAHAVTLVLGTHRPAGWSAAPGCLASRDRTELACDLGDIHESEPRTLRVTGTPGTGGEAPIVARAAAANAPAVTSSLGVMRPSAMRLGYAVSRTRGKAASAASGDANDATPERSTGHPAGAQPAPSTASTADPADVRSPATGEPGADASPEPPPAGSPMAQASTGSPYGAVSPSEAVAPAVRPGAARRLGPAPWSAAAHPRDTPAGGAPGAARAVGSPYGAGTGAPRDPAWPPASHDATAHAPVVPHTPTNPSVPVGPQASTGPQVPLAPAPPVPTQPVALPPIEGAGAAPGASPPAALPQVAAHPSRGEGISELDTSSPASALQAGRTSWATLVAVAIVTEAGLLWLIAGFTVWRRRRSPEDGRRRRLPSPRLLVSRLRS